MSKKMNIVDTIETITPQIAEKYLEHNYENNRKISQAWVNQLASDMEADEFLLNPAPIAFADDGDLIDGQHRLWACVQSNRPFQARVSRGWDKETYKIIDIGKARRIADQLDGSWRADLGTLAKATGATKYGTAGIGSSFGGRLISDGKKHSYVDISKKAIINEADKNNELLIECLKAGTKMRRVIKKWGLTAYAYFIWLIKWLGEDSMLDEYVEDFCDLSCTNGAILVPRQKMLQLANERSVKRGTWMVAALLYSYDAYRNGKDIKSLKNCEGENLKKWNKLVEEKRAQTNG